MIHFRMVSCNCKTLEQTKAKQIRTTHHSKTETSKTPGKGSLTTAVNTVNVAQG